MTYQEFMQLERGDFIVHENIDADSLKSMWRVTGRAHKDKATQEFTITLSSFITPNVKVQLCEATLNNYELTPFLKRKYGFPVPTEDN